MRFSVYTGGSVSNGTVYANSSFIDNSSGCTHSNYSIQTRITSPSGRVASASSGGKQVATSLAVAGDFGTYNILTTETLYCSCGLTYLTPSAGQPLPVQRPAYVHNYSDQNLSGAPPGCQQPVRYWKVRDYQVQDAGSQPIRRVMTVQEGMHTVQNTCGISLNMGGTKPTTASGTFRDNFYMCGSVPKCDNGGSCTVVINQSFVVDGHPVTPSYIITYTCSGVTVQ